MKDLNYFPLDVESNIYGLTRLVFEDKTSKVLVASTNCQIYCISYNKYKPHVKEVEFTYIPNGAKIISIGALKRGPDDYVIGITHSLTPNIQKTHSNRSSFSFSHRDASDSNRATTYYLNIYASGSSLSGHYDLDYVAQNCQTIRLRYVPYHLYQTELFSPRESHQLKRKPYWLLTGGDNAVHAFCEDRPYQSFTEVPIEDCFAELKNLPGLALWIDVAHRVHPQNFDIERAVALGFEDGSVRLYQSVLSRQQNKFELVRESIFDEYSTIITSVRFFKIDENEHSKLKEVLRSKQVIEKKCNHQLDQWNLFIVSSTNLSVVFRNIFDDGLGTKFELEQSRRLDCSTSGVVGDTNYDGINELLIGTHGKELLIYQYNMTCDIYELKKVSLLNYPIYQIQIFDLTGDAVKDLVILLANGVLVMQAQINDVKRVVQRRLHKILARLDAS